MSCPIKVNSNTIELTVHTSCYCFLDLLCVKRNCFVTLISFHDDSSDTHMKKVLPVNLLCNKKHEDT